MDAPTFAQFWQALPDLYLDPILTAVAAGATLGFLGVYVVTRRMVFISAALSQISGVGVALAFFLPIYLGPLPVLGEPTVLSLVLTLLGTLALRTDPQRLRLTRDSLLGLAYVVAGAVALLLGTRIAQEAHDIGAILFGTAVAVRPLDLWLTVGVGATLLLLHVLLLRGLRAVSFDPVSARVQGLPVDGLEVFLFVSIAVAVAVTTRALGALPVFAFTVLPAMGALALTTRLTWALAIAAVLGATSGALGYIYSFFFHFPVGASQAVVAGVLGLIAMATRIALSREVFAPRRVAAGIGGLTVLALAFLPALPAGGQKPALAEAAGHAHTGPSAPAVPADPEVHDAAFIAKLVATAREEADPGLRADAVHRLDHHIDAPGARETILAALSDPDWSVRAEAAEALGHHASGPSPAALVRALREDASPWVRSTAAEALGRFQDEAARAALREAAEKDPDADTRTTAARALARPPATP